MANYKVAVGPFSTGPTREITFYDSWTLDKNLDDGCTFSFSIPGATEESQAISELDTDVWLYLNGSLIERFRIIQVNQTWGASDENVVQVQAVCYRRLLGSRFVQSQLIFDQVSQGDLIWKLIQHTQTQPYGDLGITAGSLGPTVPRDRTYEIGENILDIITNLTNVIGGPTWDIDENLQLNVSRADLYPKNQTPVMLGSTASALQRPSGASLFANSVLVSGDTQSTFTVRADSSTLSTDPRGRWERRASYPSVVLQDTLNDHAYGLLTDLQAPTTVWDVQVVPERFLSDANYELGEFVRLVQPATTVAPVGQPAFEVDGQILSIQIQGGASGEIRVSMKVLQLAEPQIVAVNAFSDVTAGGYRTIVWRKNGSLISTREPLSAEYLLVGGGGGGGGSNSAQPGGGGGAGGYKTNVGGSPLTIPPGLYSIIVGDGGNGGLVITGAADSIFPGKGGGSSIGSFVSVSGGGGGGLAFNSTFSNGFAGGSGGGAGWFNSTGGAGISGEGNNGGTTPNNNAVGAAGGGGANAAGTSPTTSAGGKGGDGKTNTITGSSVTYAGGGGGASISTGVVGAGGSGGGGNGATDANGGNGTDGLGGGGGGARGTSRSGGKGGSGVVIVRFPV